MKNTLRIFFLLLSLGASTGFSVHAQGSIDGDCDFLGFIPGKHHDSLPAIRSQGKYQKLDRAVPLVNDSLSYEGIPLKSVMLYFHKGYLHSIDVKTTAENTAALLQQLQERYGSGEQADSFGSQIHWIGEANALFYELNLLTKEGLFSFYSVEVNKRYKAWLEWLNAPHE